MRVAFFDTHHFDRQAFEQANESCGHELVFFEARISQETAPLAAGFPAVCAFVNDRIDAAALSVLASGGVRLVALRAAGYNNVDLAEARRLGIRVTRVPGYSPHAVAEHAFALLLALNRKIPRAVARVREFNFTLDGLVGMDLYGKTLGVVGTGKIGGAAARIGLGLGMRVLAFDLREDPALVASGVRYVDPTTLQRESDVITLHVPLTPRTHHVLDDAAFAKTKPGVIIVNTGRGALVDSKALVKALKSGHVGGACLDVYEEEEGIFFHDLSDRVLQDDVLARLLSFPNVLVTSHQAFLTHEALDSIAETTLDGITAFEKGEALVNEVEPPEEVAKGQSPRSV